MNSNKKIVMTAFLVWFLSICMNFMGASSNSSSPKDLEHHTVFKSGDEGHHTYRIPSVIRAKDGTLIAFAEGRRDNKKDPGHGQINLVYKSSHDGGRTWSSLHILEKPKEGGCASNPTAVLDNKSGRIIIIYPLWEPGVIGRRSRPGTTDNRVMMRFSDDNGKSWSDAEDITKQARSEEWGYSNFGPGHGIQTGTGRLIIPAFANALQLQDDDPQKRAAFALYSDDGGKTWQRGQQIDVNTNENQIVELSDGRLMIDARQSSSVYPARWTAVSNDGGQTWSKPEQGQVCAQICAGLLSYPLKGKSSNSLLIWSGIKGPKRTNLILRLSYDQGKTFPIEMLIGPGPAGYSDLTLFGNGDVGMLWENGKESMSEKILFTRIPQKIVMNMYQISTLNRDVNYTTFFPDAIE